MHSAKGVSIMQPTDVRPIREAVEAAQKFAHSSKQLDAGDLDDIDQIVASLRQELSRPILHPGTLATYLNSLLRSLRTQHHAEAVVSQLIEVMDDAEIPAEV